jgi:hypothetical protein
MEVLKVPPRKIGHNFPDWSFGKQVPAQLLDAWCTGNCSYDVVFAVNIRLQVDRGKLVCIAEQRDCMECRPM